MNRRTFLAVAGAIGAGGCAPPLRTGGSASTPEFELDEITIAGLQEAMAAGRHTAQSLAQLYLARIDSHDAHGPAVNSVIEVNPDALAIAAALDRERKEKGARGPLHGVPVLIKDNIDTADRMMTTAGSLALMGNIAAKDADVARKLREAGAVIIGKTNLSEWANFRSTHSISGWSGRGGQTRNPYALDRNPCGSSSGSGAAVAANFCAVAVGTETDGSVTAPASMNGIVGIKPTLGLIGGAGIIPIAHSQDTAGPMARTVRDAAILLSALAAKPVDYTKFLNPDGLRGARIGIARKHAGFNQFVDGLLAGWIDLLKSQGAEVIDPADLPSHGKMDEPEGEVLHYEFKTDLNAYLKGMRAPARVRSLAEVIRFNEQNRDREMPYFGQEIMLKAEGKGPLSDQAYRDALALSKKLAREEGIDAVIAKHRLDAIVAPTMGPASLTDFANGDYYNGGCTTPAAVAGYPHITVPGGMVMGLPVGISFFGTAMSEPTLLKLAYAFEQASKARRSPQFLPTAAMRG